MGEIKESPQKEIFAEEPQARSLPQTSYIREFGKLMMRSELPKHKEQTIARFLGGLRQDIANMVDLQPYCSFEDVCKLAIKVEQQGKNMKPPSTKPFNKGTSFTKGSPSFTKPVPTYKDKGKEKVNELPRDRPMLGKNAQMEKKCFKCNGYGHFQANCPNRRVMTIKEIQTIEEAIQDQEEEEQDEVL